MHAALTASNLSAGAPQISYTPPPNATGCLILSDGSIFWGIGVGYAGSVIGELCFNTAMTGYQEILTDPSYAGQIITFTFPHIGNVGANKADLESTRPAAHGLIMRCAITDPSNFRATQHFNDWLIENELVGLSGVDTRRLTRFLRTKGAVNAALIHAPDGIIDIVALKNKISNWQGLYGQDLVPQVSCDHPYPWTDTSGHFHLDYQQKEYEQQPKSNDMNNALIVAVDFGAKSNILRCLADLGHRILVVPATSSGADIMRLNPDGVFLSNGPGDPKATAAYAIPMIQTLLAASVPIFGICMGHQLLALAIGAHTQKMHHGHHGANHPILNLDSGMIEITSQNHGFVVDETSLPITARPTHRSLFDGSLAGLALIDRPAFSVQYHPEASPGPHDSHYLFQQFNRLIQKQ